MQPVRFRFLCVSREDAGELAVDFTERLQVLRCPKPDAVVAVIRFTIPKHHDIRCNFRLDVVEIDIRGIAQPVERGDSMRGYRAAALDYPVDRARRLCRIGSVERQSEPAEAFRLVVEHAGATGCAGADDGVAQALRVQQFAENRHIDQFSTETAIAFRQLGLVTRVEELSG